VKTALRTAIILAAGEGKRLRDEFRDCPKGFLRLGARPIVEESVIRLAAHGIADVIIVTGYAGEHYSTLARGYPGLIRTVHNPDFARSGGMYSLYCARALTEGPFLLLESDLIYEPRALRELLDHPAPDAVLLSGPTGAGDEVFVETSGGRLLNMSKDRGRLGAGIAGELVGISKISGELFGIMQRIAAEAFHRSLAYDYETDCLVAAARERPVICPLLPDLVWGEIDDSAQLRRARELIYPRIAGLDEAVASGSQ
jgi:choline kinase